jgi:pyridoxal phosphate enzyme (YggS family)
MDAEASPHGSDLRARAAGVLGRIERAALSAGRDPAEVKLVAVSKTHPAALVREAAEMAGLRDFGENRVQEAESKMAELKEVPGLRWHLIGHLQPNKARRAVRLFDLVHTVDTAALLERLERICAEENRERLEVLAQVDLAGEATKSGATVEGLPALFEVFGRCSRVRCRGLMIIPPFFEEVEQVRPFYRRLRGLRDEWGARGAFGEEPGELSMGMSHDYEPAVEEGATLVRVGTALFGERESVA